MSSIKLTPNIKKLAIFKMTKDTVPMNGGVADVVKTISDIPKFKKTIKEGFDFALKAVEIVRNCEDPNPYKNWSDEQIAEMLVKRIEHDRRS